MTGRTISHYEILGPLGEGGMGTVFKARDRRLGRPLALKLLKLDAVSDRQSRLRFLQEAKAASALNHPNIIAVYDIGESEEGLFLAMEYVAGRTIEDLIGGEPLPMGKAVDYAIQCADALAAAHAAGIVHRDIKPGNLMVTRQGTVKVLDFGVAKVSGQGETTTLTERPVTGEDRIVGTVAYMSPEQAQGGSVDARSDIFSFGVVLYEMLTGRRPFWGGTRTATLAAILRDEPAAISGANPRVPPELERIILRCLEKDPARRFQSIADVKIALDWFLRDLEKATAGRKVQNPARRRNAVIAGVVVALVATASALLMWTKYRNAASKPSPSQVRVTFDVGLSIEPALSLDGKLLAYASDRGGDGKLAIWVQTAGSEPIRRTSALADDRSPQFSPDGASIVFQRSGIGVFAMQALQGPERLIAAAGLNPRFSPDGGRIAYWTGDINELAPSGKIFVIPFGYGTAQQLAADFADARNPIWAPGGTAVLFQGQRNADSSPEWWMVPVDGGPAVSTGTLASLRRRGVLAPTGPGDWKGSRLLFSGVVANPPGRHIWEVDLDEASGHRLGAARQITTGAGDDVDPSLAADGRFAFANWVFQDSLWRLALPRTGSGQPKLERLSKSAAYETHPSISADGRTLAFFVRRPLSRREVWIRNLETGKEHALTIGLGERTPPILSPDGSKVAYAAVEGRRLPIYVVPAQAEAEAARLVCEDCGEPSDWTGDGRRILYAAGQPRSSLYLLDTGSGARTLVLQHSDYSLDQAHISPDGRRIAFVETASAQRRVFVASLDSPAGASWAAVTDGSTWADKPRWLGDDSLVYYSGRDNFGCLWKQRLDKRTGQPIGPVSEVYHFHTLRMSPREHRRSGFEIAVARETLILNLLELSGSIWSSALPETP